MTAFGFLAYWGFLAFQSFSPVDRPAPRPIASARAIRRDRQP
jgi:hypothetical protein